MWGLFSVYQAGLGWKNLREAWEEKCPVRFCSTCLEGLGWDARDKKYSEVRWRIATTKAGTTVVAEMFFLLFCTKCRLGLDVGFEKG